MLTQARLKELFKCDPDTGLLVRISNGGGTARAGDTINTSTSDGYLRVFIDGHSYKVHRLVWLYVNGEWPLGQIDHIDGNRINNRICNIRDVTHIENSKNSALSKRNTSGCTGVYFCNNLKKWYARISYNGAVKHLGYFDRINEAITTRKEAECKYGYHENHGRIC